VDHTVHNSYKRDTHAHTDIALYIHRFLYRYIVLVYTSCTDGLYLCVHNCTLLYNLTLPKHTIVVHTLCSDQLYCCKFILLSILCTLWDITTVYTTALYNCTLTSASLASVLTTNHRRASIYLLRSDWSIRCPLERAGAGA
jgi:hypothetical protein